METKVIKIKRDSNNRVKNIEDLNEAGEILKEGGLVSFPTETVYGLGANGLDTEAVEKIYKAKGRPSDNPLILHIALMEDLERLVLDVSEDAKKCMRKFWPGPLTIILKRSELVPDIITGGLDTVAIRMPDNPVARAIIYKSGLPIAAPSANTSGRPSPTRAEHVIEDLDGKIDMIVDDGETGIGIESTVLDLSGDIPTILRPGKVTKKQLEGVLTKVVYDESLIESGKVPKSPGQKYKHYAPRSEMILYTGDVKDIIDEINKTAKEYESKGKKVGILATDESYSKYSVGNVKSLGQRFEPNTIAANLFNKLRQFDEENVDIILAEAIEKVGIGEAIMNRMEKAAGGNIVEL